LRFDIAPAPLPNRDAVDDRDPGACRRTLPAFGLALYRLKNVIAGRARASRLCEGDRQIAKLRLPAMRDDQDPADIDSLRVGGDAELGEFERNPFAGRRGRVRIDGIDEDHGIEFRIVGQDADLASLDP
jgi:hypothetical protein